jgi:hypothetical protein
MSWDEMKATSQKLTRKEGNVQYLGFVGAPPYALKMTPFSAPYLDEKKGKSTFERETWKKLIETIFIDTDAINGVLKDESIQNVFGSESLFKDKNWKGAYSNKLAPISYKSTYELQVERVYTAAVLDAIRGEKDLNTVLRETAEKADKVVAELKAASGK